jgi:hypothetical protein
VPNETRQSRRGRKWLLRARRHHLRTIPRQREELYCRLVMQFQIGDIVRNMTTREEGRIVRIANLADYGFCYIVSVAPNPIWGATARETIWEQSEVTRPKVMIPPSAP